jgi:uncharacterized protein (DUF1800 family)
MSTTVRAHDSESAAESPTSVSDRRAFLRGAGLAAAAIGASAAAPAVVNAQPPRGRVPGPAPTGAAAVGATWQDPLLRLVRRITMGMNQAEVARARQLGYSGYLNYHLNASQIDDAAVDQFVAQNYPMVNFDIAQLRTADRGMAEGQLQEATLYRAAFSGRQLHERMVEFWTDHFTIAITKDAIGNTKLLDDRTVIRRHALGNFREMLHASAKSTAMILYLDQQLNRFDPNNPNRPVNQNYAREIMELHTLGVYGGYTQDDVAQLARILSGWGARNFEFFVTPTAHDWNAKTWMGRTIPAVATPALRTAAAAQLEGEQAIDFLLDHPSTARYISWKMARWLLQYDPPQAAVDAAAAAYTSTRGDIKSMIRAILTRTNLMASEPLYKRPFHFAMSAMRTMGTTAVTAAGHRNLRFNYDNMNMRLFYWEQPNGWPFQVEWWSGLVLQRWQFAGVLANQNSTNYSIDIAKFTRAGSTPEAVATRIIEEVFAGEVTARFRTELVGFLRGTPASNTVSAARLRDGLALAMSSTPFQWY